MIRAHTPSIAPDLSPEQREALLPDALWQDSLAAKAGDKFYIGPSAIKEARRLAGHVRVIVWPDGYQLKSQEGKEHTPPVVSIPPSTEPLYVDVETEPNGTVWALGWAQGGENPRYGLPVSLDFLGCASGPVVAYNAHFDLNALGVPCPERIECALVRSWVQNLSERGISKSLSLKDVAPALGFEKMETFDKAIGRDIRKVPVDVQADYCCRDVRALRHVWQQPVEAWAQRRYAFERQLIPVLHDMRQRGLYVDPAKVEQEIARLEGEVRELKSLLPMQGLASSPRKLEAYLFDDLGLTPVKMTESGRRSTDESVLESLDHPVAKLVLAIRRREKLLSTYLYPWRESGGRLHPSWNQTGTRTNRLSCSDPNVQNIPPELWHCFVAPPGMEILYLDYSQIELRVMAVVSQDPAMLEEYRSEDADLHRRTALLIGAPRSRGKTINFGLAYGMGIGSFVERTGLPYDVATNMIQRIRGAYTGYANWTAEVVDFCAEHGYVETQAGFRRYIPNINSPFDKLRADAEREAINTPIQGGAMDIVKSAMLRLKDKHMVCQIHDALVFYVEKGEPAEPYIEAAETELAGVRFPVKASRGPSWGEAN